MSNTLSPQTAHLLQLVKLSTALDEWAGKDSSGKRFWDKLPIANGLIPLFLFATAKCVLTGNKKQCVSAGEAVTKSVAKDPGTAEVNTEQKINTLMRLLKEAESNMFGVSLVSTKNLSQMIPTARDQRKELADIAQNHGLRRIAKILAA
jgi:hypothetical protein